MPRTILLAPAAALLVLAAACQADRVTGPATAPQAPALLVTGSLSATAQLGKSLFDDVNLSVGRNQSCRTCHEPAEGGAAPLLGVTSLGSVVQGSVPGRFGDRKPPTTAYATLTPNFAGGGNPIGGLFWDGRATGAVLGNPAADQALGPFLNPKEQALPDQACIAWRIRTGSYLAQYTTVYGADITSIVFPDATETVCTTPEAEAGIRVSLSTADRARATTVYHNVARAIAAFEDAQNTFSSKFDRGQLSGLELQGQKLFSGKGKCQQCHTNKGARAPFTDFRFHNLGVPKNPANPVYHLNTTAWDKGLGGVTGRSADMGKFRTPTTRNVGEGTNRTFMHNGALVSLLQVVDFYNTRDAVRACTGAELLDPLRWGTLMPNAFGCWPRPEYPQNMDTKQMGKLGLTRAEVEAIVAYLHAMTDLP